MSLFHPDGCGSAVAVERPVDVDRGRVDTADRPRPAGRGEVVLHFDDDDSAGGWVDVQRERQRSEWNRMTRHPTGARSGRERSRWRWTDESFDRDAAGSSRPASTRTARAPGVSHPAVVRPPGAARSARGRRAWRRCRCRTYSPAESRGHDVASGRRQDIPHRPASSDLAHRLTSQTTHIPNPRLGQTPSAAELVYPTSLIREALL
jgi:hypothetical protein